jgi:hypothetical protein
MGRGQGKRRQNNSRRKGQGNGTHNNRNSGGGNRSNGNTDFVNTVVDLGNYKMEAYYAAQGLHDTRWNDEDKLVACETDEEKEVERQKWRTSKYNRMIQSSSLCLLLKHSCMRLTAQLSPSCSHCQDSALVLSHRQGCSGCAPRTNGDGTERHVGKVQACLR